MEKPAEQVTDQVYKYNVKRIKKRINDYILDNYDKLFFAKKENKSEDTCEESPLKNDIPMEYQNKTLTQDDIVNNPQIISKVQTELLLCEEPDRKP